MLLGSELELVRGPSNVMFSATSIIDAVEDGRVDVWVERGAAALSLSEPGALLVMGLGPESVTGPSNVAVFSASFCRLAARGEPELSLRFIPGFDRVEDVTVEDGSVDVWLERRAAVLSLSTPGAVRYRVFG